MNHLILLHGALGTADDFHLLEKQFHAANLKVERFNFQGHGHMPLATAFNIPAFSLELLEFIEKKKISKPYVFGYSMGGYVALNAALSSENCFSGIITLGTKFDWTEAFTTKETNKLNPEFLLEKAPDFAEALQKKHGPFWTELLALTSEMMVDLHKTHQPFLEAMNKIKIPVWILRGSKDKMVNFEESVLVSQKIPNSEYHELPETPHAIEMVSPEALALIIHNFIKTYSVNEAPANG